MFVSTCIADSEFTSKMKHRAQTATPGSNITKSSSVGGDMCSLGRNDDDEDDKKRRSSFGAKMAAMVGLGKKSQSTSQLDPEGRSSVLGITTVNVVGAVCCHTVICA